VPKPRSLALTEVHTVRTVMRYASWRTGIAALALALGLVCLPRAALAETWVVGPDGQPNDLAGAVARAQDGDVIDVLPGVYKGVHLVLDQRRLTLRGSGEKAPVIDGEGTMGPYPALLVVRGGEVLLENLEFRGARSEQSSGAGVRQEGGQLTLRNCHFRDNEHGLSTNNDAQAELTIEASSFGMAPRVEGGLYHLLNVGRIGRLTISGSRFQQGFEGHLIRSRARETTLSYNMIHDGPGGGASYEVDLPNGGLVTLIGNVIGQGRNTQNPVVVAYGTEGEAWERNRLVLAHNTFLNYGWVPAWFLRVFEDRLPADTEVIAINNLTAGTGLFSLGNSGHFEGNGVATFSMLLDVETYAFELPPSSYWRGKGVDPRNVGGLDLSPQAEFRWPVGIEKLPALGRWSPGAYQR
jgi:hypothetical protein